MELIPRHIRLDEKLGEVEKPWCPIELARCNGQIVRLAKFNGTYHWHSHAEEDELFFVYRGAITIQVRGKPDLVLREGEWGMVPKGTEHCPKSDGDSYVLMIEPATLQSSGD
jgi:mannose-6-phosphate isomerase-like protein (cupin superfamily)